MDVTEDEEEDIRLEINMLRKVRAVELDGTVSSNSVAGA